MPTRNDILTKAVDDCIKEIYSIAQPEVDWKNLIQQCKEYSEKYLEWEEYKKDKIQKPEWEGKNITKCIGPRPYEFYYVPNTIQKEIADSYIYSYKIDNQQELLNTILILKDYCRKPIVDKYIDDWTDEYGNHHPGYRSYDHPDNLKTVIANFLNQKYNSLYNFDEECAKELQDKFFEFLNMAGNFYNWNHELNTFNMNVFLGIAPSTNKEKVIDNWKQYRGKDIVIDDSKFEEDYE